MKKFLLLVIILITPIYAFAVSGTCSDHGGVNCSIGPDWDGSAICNDGWNDSGELYFNQTECSNTPMCTAYLWQQMSNIEEIRDGAARYSYLVNLINTLNIQYPIIEIQDEQNAFGRGVTMAGLITTIQSDQKRNRDTVATSTYEATLLDQKLRKIQLEINKTCIASGITSQQTENIPQIRPQSVIPPQESYIPSDTASELTDLCVENGIKNAHQVGTNQCVCNSGYYKYNNQCIDILDYCSLTLGSHGIVSGQSSCGCSTGYSLNSQKNSCVYVEPSVKKVVTQTANVSSASGNNSKEIPENIQEVVVTTSVSTTTSINPINQIENRITPVSHKSLFQKIKSWFLSLFDQK